MVKSILVVAFSACTVLHAARADGMSDDASPFRRDPHLPKVKSITIEENGAVSPAAKTSTEECRAFVMDENDVREYLEHAGRVTRQDYFHMLDWSPCYAGGKVVFKGGLTGTWAIQQFKAGSLSLNDGRRLFLYCPGCKANAFTGP